MDVFNELPPKKRAYMNLLFQNCSEEVKYYMTLTEVEADTTLIKAGERCNNIYIILSGKVTGIDWRINERAYSFKDFGPGDFFGEIECFADLLYYRISVVTVTKCRVLTIPAAFYMEWIQNDAEALYSRTKVNMRRLITQTTDARRYLFLEAKERLVLYLCEEIRTKSGEQQDHRYESESDENTACGRNRFFDKDVEQKHQNPGGERIYPGEQRENIDHKKSTNE